MTRPRILAIGSCRIFRPLRAQHEANSITLLNHSENWWFTHTAAEAWQYVQAVAGCVDIPSTLRPLICETSLALPDTLVAPSLLDADAVIVEVSTMKSLTTDGFSLNYHKVWGHAEAAGIDSKAVLQGQAPDLPAGSPLERLRVGRATADEVENALLQIRAAVGVPVVTVDHLHATMPGGGLAPERAEIREHLLAAQERHALPLWSTKQFIEHRGHGSLKDHNHWNPSVEAAVGDALVRFTSSLLLQSATP